MGFFDVITEPEKTLDAHLSKETLGTGLKRMGGLLLLVGIILGILAQLAASLLEAVGASLNIAGLPPIIIVPLLVLILGLILVLLASAILFAVARLLGGKGTFGQQFGASTLMVWPSFVVLVVAYIILAILALVGSIGAIIGMIVLYLAIGFLAVLTTYFGVLYLKAVHGLNTYRVAVAQAIQIAIIIILVMILVLSLVTSIFGAMGIPLSGLKTY